MSRYKGDRWIGGGHWVECMRCGDVRRNFNMKKEWTGLIVCPDCWEPRHPQDLIRVKSDKIAARGIVNTLISIVSVAPCSPDATAGVAIAGCAVAGVDVTAAANIPTATNDGSL